MSAPNIETATTKIKDALRYSDLCAAALDSDRIDARCDVSVTLSVDLQNALYEALEALGDRPVEPQEAA